MPARIVKVPRVLKHVIVCLQVLARSVEHMAKQLKWLSDPELQQQLLVQAEEIGLPGLLEGATGLTEKMAVYGRMLCKWHQVMSRLHFSW